MATNPVDDPRTPTRQRAGTASAGTIEQQVTGAIEQGFTGLSDTVLKGFDTVLKTSNAALKEVAEAKRDLQQTLDMVIRAKADALALGGGMGGMAPAAARTPMAIAVQQLDEAKEIRHRAAQPTDANYQRQARDAKGRFIKREQAVEEVQQQREDRFDDADQRRQEATAQRAEQHQARQQALDRNDVDRQDRAAQVAAPGAVSPASTGARARLDYNAAVSEGGFRGVVEQTREGIRERVYRSAASRAETYVDPQGMVSDIASRQVERIRPGLRPDPASENFLDEAGKVIPRAEAMTPVGSQAAVRRRSMISQMGMRSLNAWREGAPIGRSLAAALPDTLLQGAGQAAVVVSAANRVWEGIQDQAAKNREFQSVYAGSNTDQIGNRVDRWVNRNITGRFSMLGGGNYDALYGQGMNLGLQGDTLHGYIREGAQIMGTGANKQQTGEILGIATETGQALNGLSDAIKGVNAAAKDAGINAARAREIFIKNYQASSDIMFGGSASQRMAQAITQAQVGMGRQFQDVDMTGSYSGDMRQRLLASRAGVPYTDFMTQSLNNPNLLMLTSEAEIQSQLGGLRSETQGETRTIGDVVSDYMDSIGGPEQFNAQFDQRELGEAVRAAGFSPELLAMFLQQNGVTVNDPNDAPAIAAMYFTNQTPGQIGQASDAERMAAVAPGSSFADLNAAMEFTGADSGNIDALRQMYVGGLNPNYANAGGNDPMTPEEAGVHRRRNLITEKFIDPSVRDSLGVDQSTQLRITTSDGQRRVVELQWALQNTPDQIPTAMIMSGAHDDVIGKTVEEALNLPTGTAAQYGTPVAPILSQDDLESDEVTTMADWNVQHAKDLADSANSGTGTTHVVLDLTPLARQLLQPVSSGAAYSPGNSGTGGYAIDVSNSSPGE
jgi:hypothetical protein